jgi:endonuclease G, mitochondrial
MKSAKLIGSIFLIIAIVTVFFCKNKNANYFINNVLQKENNDSNSVTNALDENGENSNQTFNFLPTSTTNQIVKHQYYTLSYNEKYEQAEWVAYELKKSFATKNHFKRPFFIEDSKVSTGSADWKNYKKSGYDKGHLCPAGDMSFDKNAYDDTFFTSNISPQVHDFNDGVWNRLEQKTRYWAAKYNDIYVITGGVLQPDLKTIGKENVAVPKYFYKILLDNADGDYKMIAFLVPAIDSEKPLYSFVTAVDVIEKMTGIDFFPKLDDKTENSLEKNSDYKAWSF